MFLFPVISLDPSLYRIDYVTSSTATEYNGTITLPSQIEEGDLIIVGQMYGDGSTATEPNYTSYVGTGFTAIGSAYAPGIDWVYQHAVSYKVADGSEAGSAVGGFMPEETGANVTAGIFVYRPVTAIASVTAQDVFNYGGTGDPAANVITASASSAATISVAFSGGNNDPALTWSGSSDAELNVLNGSADARMRSYAAAKGQGEDITADINDTGANHITSFYLEVS